MSRGITRMTIKPKNQPMMVIRYARIGVLSFAAGDFTISSKLCRAFKNFLPQVGFYIFFFVIMILILATYESGREALR